MDDQSVLLEKIAKSAVGAVLQKAVRRKIGQLLKAFNPSQPRDRNGRWIDMQSITEAASSGPTSAATLFLRVENGNTQEEDKLIVALGQAGMSAGAVEQAMNLTDSIRAMYAANGIVEEGSSGQPNPSVVETAASSDQEKFPEQDDLGSADDYKPKIKDSKAVVKFFGPNFTAVPSKWGDVDPEIQHDVIESFKAMLSTDQSFIDNAVEAEVRRMRADKQGVKWAIASVAEGINADFKELESSYREGDDDVVSSVRDEIDRLARRSVTHDIMSIADNYIKKAASDDALFKHAKDGGFLTGVGTTPKERAKALGLSEVDIASIVGAPDDATVYVASDDSYDKGGIRISVSGSQIEDMMRIVHAKDGVKVIENKTFFLKDKYVDQGIGAEIFEQAVHNLRKRGFVSMHTHAAKGPGMNGYYTWPRFGYGASVENLVTVIRDEVRQRVPNAGDIRDIMQTKQGRDYWKANGHSLGMEFDLSDGSRSMDVFSKYMAERQRNKLTNTTKAK